MKVKQEQVTIEAHDGACRAWLLGPEGDGQWPAVSVYMDALAIRPAMIELAATIAAAGYVVLLPDMFYRFGPYDTLDANTVLAQDFRTVLGPMMASVDNSKSALDTACFLEYLASLPQVRPGPVGTTGYCMGGGMSLTATYPDRVAAAASFHGGSLATDSSRSPHLLASQMKAEIYVAGADRDRSYPPEMAQRLASALEPAGVKPAARSTRERGMDGPCPTCPNLMRPLPAGRWTNSSPFSRAISGRNRQRQRRQSAWGRTPEPDRR